MAFNPLHYRFTQAAIGSPEDDKATSATDSWSMVALLKGIWNQLNGTLTVTNETSATDDAAYTFGTGKVGVIGGVYASARDAVDSGDAGALAMTAKRAAYISPETPNGDSLVDDTNDLLKVAIIPGQNGVAAGAGAVDAKTPRVTVATDDGLHTKLGEVQDSPTANTVLGRLKDLLTGIVLAGGANVIGKVGIDQTTPGTTNAVSPIAGQSGVAAGAGAVDAKTPRVTLASDDPLVAGLKAEDAPHVSGDVGMMALAVRKDTAASMSSADGDYTPLQVTSFGLLRVAISAGASEAVINSGGSDASTNTAAGLLVYDRPSWFNGTTWDRARTVANGLDSTGTGIAASGIVAQYDDVSTNAVTENNFAPLRIDAERKLMTKALGLLANPSANFNRPADTTAYASGDLVANSTTAGSVTPLSWTAARVAAGSFFVRRARLKKSGTSITNANFRLHLYAAAPTCANGDNGAWSTSESSYLGAIDIAVDKAFTDAARGDGVPTVGGEINVALASGQTLYGLLEARGAYTPATGETFTVALELHQN